MLCVKNAMHREMTTPKRYQEYEAGIQCCVHGCAEPAEYEVYLYDYYPYLRDDPEFFEQDFTCPFLCKAHMEENEAKANGERKPRGFVQYPYSNQRMAQGYTKYVPLASLFPILYSATGQQLSRKIVTTYQTVNDELIEYLARHPEMLRGLDPRRFEELIAELFARQGFDVTLTPRTRDGGKDVYAIKNDEVGKSLYLIECKRYAATNKVGVETVRALYGVATAENATKGIIATTSSFTKGAIDFATPLEYKLSLRDFDALKQWLCEFAGHKNDA
jgi:hypothetical protein